MSSNNPRNNEEYLQEFGRLTRENSFKDIVESDARKNFLMNQRLMAGRQDCLVCEYAGRCIYEVYKPEYDTSEECIGAKRFVQWVDEHYGVINDDNGP